LSREQNNSLRGEHFVKIEKKRKKKKKKKKKKKQRGGF